MAPLLQNGADDDDNSSNNITKYLLYLLGLRRSKQMKIDVAKCYTNEMLLGGKVKEKSI